MPTPTALPARQLNKAQVADLLGVSEWTVERLVHDGRLRCYRPTVRIWRFDEADVVAFKAACCQGPVSAAPSPLPA
jgi:excisionase family DNA binding protein